MSWTCFWTDHFYAVSHNYGVGHNPILIELPKSQALAEFIKIFGSSGVISTGSYKVIHAPTLEEVTAFYRGCVLTELGFVEESRGDQEFKYSTLSKFLSKPSVLVIPNKFVNRQDGLQCARCREFILWAESNQEDGTFICRPCREDPYR